MRKSDFRADKVHAALLQRQAEATRLLDLKDSTKPYEFSQGFVFLIRGAERQRIVEEAAFIASLLDMLANPGE
jgi:hypothetical protein